MCVKWDTLSDHLGGSVRIFLEKTKQNKKNPFKVKLEYYKVGPCDQYVV